jgi:hypothetical protein
MNSFLAYWLWPHLTGWDYGMPKIQAMLLVFALLIVFSFILRYWRNKLTNPITRNLTASWSSASFWFGLIGLILVVSRAEEIQFLAMRALWVVWAFCLVLYVVFQWIQFRRKHYVLLKRTEVTDERDRYLPKKK